MFTRYLLKTCLTCGQNQQAFLKYTTNIFNQTLFQFQTNIHRSKYTQNQGVKGIRNRKFVDETNVTSEISSNSTLGENGQAEITSLNLDDQKYDQITSETMHVQRRLTIRQDVFIIQPYIKWGAKKETETTPDDQLEEAKALVRSLPNWHVALSLKVPLESLERKTLFGTGKLEELKNLVQQMHSQGSSHPLTCLFVSKGSLSFAQKRFLEAEFHLPVMDRYSVVIQILRLHATSAEARIQVAMAEIPYIWSQARDANPSMSRKQGYSLTDTQREILKSRERKLKLELERIRSQRKLLRNKRKQKNYPIVAVIGYTNAGKTSLIKALTNEEKMRPRDQLFATLDVTAHAGVLPCNLEVIYMDTVGFMSDLPTGLIECFVATLEDALLADLIIHVQDMSHKCCSMQKRHVESTLSSLIENMQDCDLPPIINVANKIDLISEKSIDNSKNQELYMVSAKQQSGLGDLLMEIERKILISTRRQKITVRVSNGGSEMAWLYKNAAVVNVKVDESNSNHLLMDIVIDDQSLQQFKRSYCR